MQEKSEPSSITDEKPRFLRQMYDYCWSVSSEMVRLFNGGLTNILKEESKGKDWNINARRYMGMTVQITIETRK